MWLKAVEDEQVAGFHFYFLDSEAGNIGLEMVAVFGLSQLPGIVSAEEFRNTLKAAHVFIHLVGKRENALHVLRFCFGIIVPMNKRFILEARAQRKIKIGAVYCDP